MTPEAGVTTYLTGFVVLRSAAILVVTFGLANVNIKVMNGTLERSDATMSLATWDKDDGITILDKGILDGSALGSFGHVRVKVLSSSSVAPYCDDAIKALEAKNPYKPSPSIPNITFSKPPL
uniref:Auxilin-like protein n=1 Tax=Tanacetum cinerariifolium TaxID=118510 RepID=A0A6L2LMZ5_TANCI|nr:auxilin-like protein [Tanacetum cinerariifolium]